MNKGQKALTGIALIVFLAMGLVLANSPTQGELIGFGVMVVVYIGMMFMLKKSASKP
jgi:hypothetical protein